MKIKVGFALAILFVVQSAHAIIRPIFTPGDKQLIVMMQGVSSSGFDPEPRALYDAIKAKEVGSPGGGTGKVIKVEAKDFSLTCGHKGEAQENVLCNLVVKKSARGHIDSKSKLARFVLENDPEAMALFTQFVGEGATEPFAWATQNGWLRFESTPDRFVFEFKQ